MKKIYTLLFGAALAGNMFAQQPPVAQEPQQGFFIPDTDPMAARIRAMQHADNFRYKMSSATVYQRMSPTDTMYGNNSSAPSMNTGYFVYVLYMDSTVKYTFGTTTSNVWANKAGGVFNAGSSLFGASAVSAFQPYLIDTIWVAGLYNKKAATVGDTLQLEVNWGDTTSAWYQRLYNPNLTPKEYWVMPKNTFSASHGNKSFQTAPVTNSAIMKHVMTIADTGGQYIPYVFSTPLSIPAGGFKKTIVSLQYTFVPKLANTPQQNYYTSPTNNATCNSYLAYARGQNGPPFNQFFYDMDISNNRPNYNTSGVLNSKARYGRWTGSQAALNGVMQPTANAGMLWRISLHFTPTGINELQKFGVTLHQNIPNPFDGTSLVGYNLENSSDVLFTVYDMAGRIVMQNNFERMSAGEHTFTLDASDFSKGVYFYNIKANGASLTKKMIITE